MQPVSQNTSNLFQTVGPSVFGECVKVECVRGAEGAVGAVMRRPGVGPQDAVQHAGAEPSV